MALFRIYSFTFSCLREVSCLLRGEKGGLRIFLLTINGPIPETRIDLEAEWSYVVGLFSSEEKAKEAEERYEKEYAEINKEDYDDEHYFDIKPLTLDEYRRPPWWPPVE